LDADGGIPLTRLHDGDAKHFAELIGAIERVAAAEAFIGGDALTDFERDYGTWCETPHVVGVSSGTDALVLVLRALEIGPGDEVVVPANSFIATAEAVSLVGATPRFADVDERTQLLVDATLEQALSPRVRCVIPVHLYGRTVEMASIMEVARAYGLSVIEDAAQAHGARYCGRRVGTIGDAGAFSFYPSKNLGAWGDGGAVVCGDAELADRIRLLRAHGERPRHHHRMIGTTARLDGLQAAVLRTKLPRLEAANETRARLAGALRYVLADSSLVLPAPPNHDGDHVYHQFVVRTPCRDALREHLAARGIATGIHYPIPIHRSEAYRTLTGERDVAPVASRLAGEILSLPIFPGMSHEQIERIGAAVRDFESQLEPRVTPLEPPR
jgi:dTDP-4-amino-4,6-dideoxygalactose transaminase